MNDETRGAVTRLAAEVVRAACGLLAEESPELDMGAETARIMALRAKDEIVATRAAFAAEAALREALEGQLREVERERDAYRDKAARLCENMPWPRCVCHGCMAARKLAKEGR